MERNETLLNNNLLLFALFGLISVMKERKIKTYL